ncbi:MAG: tetratricopeptide repeat protein [Alphaproteobacteria bacterium]|nr:tetratricopeptide repeat protein [Alphaproteobacteria bacterium]
MAAKAKPQLDACFERLSAARSEEEAQSVEADIWRLWSDSGNAATDRLLATGSRALSRGRFAPAIALFNALVERAPDFAEAWNKRATLYYLIGEYEFAATDIQRTIEREPRHFGALSGLGMIYLQWSDKARALKAFEEALSVHPYLSGARNAVESLSKALTRER